jgi:EmrB/QacA subfamily drug resistance transporter
MAEIIPLAPNSETVAANQRVLPWLVAVAFLLQSVDTTILNTAVPVVAKALNVAPLAMRSVLATYTLSLAMFIPISGWMADRFGTRRVFASAIALFTIASLLCGLCNDFHLLVACRVLQGAGGAMMVPVGRLALVRTFSRMELVRAMGFVAIPSLIGPMLGPVAGGLIVSYLSWRFIFFVNLPIGLAGLILVFLYMPDYRERTGAPLDVVGMILFGSGITLLSYVLEVFGEHTLNSAEIVGLGAISIVLIVGYVLYAARQSYPLLDLGLFRIRTFSAAAGGAFVARLGMGGVTFLLPVLYQVGLGLSPIASGLLVMPQAVAAMPAKFLLPPMLSRFGYRTVLVANTVILSLLIMAFANVSQGTPVWAIVVLALCYGGFQSLQYTSMNTLVYADIAREKTSQASSIASTFQQLSLSFGVAAAGLTAAFFIPAGARSNHVEFTHGVHHALLALSAFTLASTSVFWRLRTEDGGAVRRKRGLGEGP